MAQIYTIYRLNAVFTLVLGCPANLFLIWLIQYRTSSALRIWSLVLLQNAITDLVLICTTFIIQSTVASEGPNIYWVVLGPFAKLNNDAVLFAGCYFQSFLVDYAKYAVAVQYFYRWLVICREQHISICKYMLCQCVPVFLAFLHNLFIWYNVSLQANNALKNSDSSEVYLYCFNAGMEGFINKLSGLYSTAMNWATFMVVITLNFLIWLKTRKSILPEQQRSARISRQVGRVLLIQALLPLVLQTIPTILLILSIMIGNQLSWVSSFLYSQTWIACIYPMATMAIIGHYRKQIKKLMTWTNTSIFPSTA